MIFHPGVRYKNWLQLALIHQKKTVKSSHKLAQIGADWRRLAQSASNIGAGLVQARAANLCLAAQTAPRIRRQSGKEELRER